MTTTISMAAPPHLYGPSSIITIEDRPDRASQTERSCKTCGLVKITVHGKVTSWREWREKDNSEQFCSKVTPECRAAEKEETT